MKNLIYLLVIVILVSGCGTPSVYREVFREGPARYNSRTFPYSQETVYTALLKTLYSRKFIVENENKENGNLLAKRSFQKGKRTIALLLQAKFIAGSEDTTIKEQEKLIEDRKFYQQFFEAIEGKIQEGEK